MLRAIAVIGTIVFSISAAAAAANVGGGPVGGGNGFMCGEPSTPNFCSCTGGEDSVDCKNMKKNCSGPIKCPPLLDNCTCDYTAAKGGTGKPKAVIKQVPSGKLKANP